MMNDLKSFIISLSQHEEKKSLSISDAERRSKKKRKRIKNATP